MHTGTSWENPITQFFHLAIDSFNTYLSTPNFPKCVTRTYMNTCYGDFDVKGYIQWLLVNFHPDKLCS